MKPRRGILFCALTLVLGVAVLSATLAAPQLQRVRSYDAAAVENQSRSSAQQGLQSPAQINVSRAVVQADTIDGPVFATVDEHNKDADNRLPGVGTKDWQTDIIDVNEKLDVLSAYKESTFIKDDTLFADDVEDIIVPGTEGLYHFTLTSQELVYAADYYISIIEGPETNDDFPMLYRLQNLNTGAYLTDNGGTAWVPLEDLEDLDPATPFDGKVNAGESIKFALEWKWEFDITGNAARDVSDTALGEKVQDESTVPFYQLQLKVHLEFDVQLYIYFDPEGGFVTPTEREYNRGDTYGDLPIPTKDGYTFVGWVDKDGNPITSDTVIPDNGGTVYAVWEEDEKKGFDWDWLLPIIIPLPIPIIIPGFLALLVPGLVAWLVDRFRPEETTTTKPPTDEPTTQKPGASETDPTTKKPDSGYVRPPKTGDSNYLLSLSAASALAALGGVLLLLRKRKEDEQDQE